MKKIVCLYGTPNEIVNQLNAKAVDYAAARGLEYQWIPMQPFSNDAAVEALKGADAGIIDVEVYDKDIFTRINDSVKILVRYGVGFDAVNLKDATDAGIAIARTTAANAEGVAEMAFTMIMAAKRQLMRNRDCVNTGNWVRNVGGEMLGKKVGIMGFGAIGRKVAKLFGGFDCEILAYDPFLPAEACAAAGARKVELEELFRESDAVTVHVPYTKENHHIVNAERIAMMKKDAVIVCTARGNLVDEDALAEALKAGKICAGVDVYEKEPPLPAGHPLLGVPNLVCTPHVGFDTRESIDRRAEMAFENVTAWMAGTPVRVML